MTPPGRGSALADSSHLGVAATNASSTIMKMTLDSVWETVNGRYKWRDGDGDDGDDDGRLESVTQLPISQPGFSSLGVQQQ